MVGKSNGGKAPRGDERPLGRRRFLIAAARALAGLAGLASATVARALGRPPHAAEPEAAPEKPLWMQLREAHGFDPPGGAPPGPEAGAASDTVKGREVASCAPDTHCLFTCLQSCQTSCETSACQQSCQDACEGSCQSACESDCQSACESACQDSCEQACQDYCQAGQCQYTCMNSCQDITQ